MPKSKRDTVADAQLALRAGSPRLVVDGAWGPKTQRAYDRAATVVQQRVDGILAEAGLTVKSIGIYQASGGDERRAQDPSKYVSAEQVDSIVEKAARDIGLGEYAEAFKQFVRREAKRVVINGQEYFDHRSRNGLSRGLMQMQPAAWVDAYAIDSSIGGYDNVYDPESNLKAGIAYAKRNIAGLKRLGLPVNGDVLYLAHNQGLGFFSKGIVTNLEGQSAEARALIEKYRQRRNT